MSKTPNEDSDVVTEQIQELVQEIKRLLQELKECRDANSELQNANSELQNEKSSLMSALCLMSADMNTKACHTNKGSDTQIEVQEADDAEQGAQ